AAAIAEGVTRQAAIAVDDLAHASAGDGRGDAGGGEPVRRRHGLRAEREERRDDGARILVAESERRHLEPRRERPPRGALRRQPGRQRVRQIVTTSEVERRRLPVADAIEVGTELLRFAGALDVVAGEAAVLPEELPAVLGERLVDAHGVELVLRRVEIA